MLRVELATPWSVDTSAVISSDALKLGVFINWTSNIVIKTSSIIALILFCHINCLFLPFRLPRIHLARTSMLLSSTSRTSSAHPPRSSLTRCMTPTARVLTLCVGTPSASGRAPTLLSPTACGWTSLTMMLPHSWSSLRRGMKGTAVCSHFDPIHYIITTVFLHQCL